VHATYPANLIFLFPATCELRVHNVNASSKFLFWVVTQCKLVGTQTWLPVSVSDRTEDKMSGDAARMGGWEMLTRLWSQSLKRKYVEVDASITQKVLERTKSPTFLALFNNAVSVILFNNCKLHTLAYMITSPTMVTEVKQWVKLWDPLLRNYGSCCPTRMVWLPWFPHLTFDIPRQIVEGFASTWKVWTSVILKRLKLWD
jgi:hypothetical protein